MALIPVALAAVYLIWSSSTLAMRVALETMPPFLLGACRYLAAGALLYGVLRARGVAAPTRAQWASCAKLAILFLVVGNGAVALAGSHVPCSIVAMVGATMPLMASLVEGIGRRRASRIEMLGVALGVVGVGLLNVHGELAACGSALLMVALSPLAWAVGTVLCRRMETPAGPMATAAQLLTGGAMMLVMSLVFREHVTTDVSARSLAALVYLTIFGSLIAFTAYGFLLRHAKPAIATSHAYVNPLIALALGARVANDRPSNAALFACLVLLSGVATITVAQLRTRAQTREPTPGRNDAGERLSIIEKLANRAGERLSLS